MTEGRTIVVVTAPVGQVQSSQPAPAAEAAQAATVVTSVEMTAVRSAGTMISVAMTDQATGTAETTAAMTGGQAIVGMEIAIEETITVVMVTDVATEGMETEGTAVGVTDGTIDAMAIVEAAMMAAAVAAETEIATGTVEIGGMTEV